MIWGFQKTRSDMDRKWSAHGLSDVFGGPISISKERTLISRQTRMMQDLEDQNTERIRKLTLHEGILGDDHSCQQQPQKMAD
jgi:hypothetical protein